ncbi:MAG: beta-galactosidase [Candidatus Omnitrophota bacterium]
MKPPVEFKDKSLWIKGERTFLWSGEMHYFRIPEDTWQDRLQKARAAFINCTATYFPWNWHEPEKGKYDFHSFQHNAGKYLDMAAKAGLWIVARPGPYICAEWDLGGHPGWLLKRPGDWRTGDPEYIKECRKWYKRINQEIVSRQTGSAGNVILYQLENEQWGGEPELLKTLQSIALKDGVRVPTFTNSGGNVRKSGSKVIDLPDVYTNPWEIKRWQQWFNDFYHDLGPEVPLLVLETPGGWYASWGEQLPDIEQGVPVDWTDMLVKAEIAFGANGVTLYKYSGCIIPNWYGCDHCPTTYFDNACITPWGQLHERYYRMRLLGGLLDSLGSRLAETKPDNLRIATRDGEAEAFARRGKGASFLFVFNHSLTTKKIEVNLWPDKLEREPELVKVSIPARQAYILPFDLDLEHDIRLRKTNTQIFRILHYPELIRIIVFGPQDEKGELDFSSFKPWEVVREKAAITAGDGLRLKVQFDSKVQVSIVKTGDITLEIYATTQDVAGRTWFLKQDKREIPVFSNIYFMRDGFIRKNSASLSFEAEPDKKAWFLIPKEKFVGTIAAKTGEGKIEPRKDGLMKASIKFIAPKPISFPLRDWFFKTEPDASSGKFDDEDWGEIPGWEAPELHGFHQNGYFWYRKEFEASGKEKNLFFSGFNGEAVFYLNEKVLGCLPEQRLSSYPLEGQQAVFDLTGKLRSGRNILAVRLEFIGRHNHGVKQFNGITAPVAISSFPEEEVILEKWKVKPRETHVWAEKELDKVPNEAQLEYDTTSWMDVSISPKRLSNWVPDIRESRHVRWYRSEIEIPYSWEAKETILTLPHVDESWVYIDGKLIGKSHSCNAASFYLTPHLKRKNRIGMAIAIRYRWHWLCGLQKPPKIHIFDRALDGAWKVRHGTFGEEKNWHGMEVSEPSWTRTIPKRAHIVWCRAKFQLPAKKKNAPALAVRIKICSSRAVIYVNGESIGRYCEIGPQEDFFIPGHLLRRENTLTLMLDGYGKTPKLGKISIETIYQVHPLEIKLS